MNAIPIHAFNPGPITGDGNWTWLIPGRVPTLIDAGTGDTRHLDAVEQALGGARLAQVLVTHAHVDHASGAQAIADRFGPVRFLKRPWADRDAKWSVAWEAIGDDAVIEAGDSSLVAVHTPGHAPDHLCFWHADTRTLFCGDLAIKGTTVWIPPRLHGDMADYLASLERVIALRPARMLPAHGPVIDDPDRLLRHYVRHRQEREGQVLEALGLGDRTAQEVAVRLYPTLTDSAIALAQENVLAHLLKLEREGRARRDGDAWNIIEP